MVTSNRLPSGGGYSGEGPLSLGKKRPLVAVSPADRKRRQKGVKK